MSEAVCDIPNKYSNFLDFVVSKHSCHEKLIDYIECNLTLKISVYNLKKLWKEFNETV